MDKVEKIHKLDQSPYAYTVVHGVISESDKILIEDIRLRYGYKGDLLHHLTTLPSWVNLHRYKTTAWSPKNAENSIYENHESC